MKIPKDLDSIATKQERYGAKVFFTALKAQYTEMARQVENGQELKPNKDIIKNALVSFHSRTQLEVADWQYNKLIKENPVKALQIGVYERVLGLIRTWITLNIGGSITSISDTTRDIVRKIIADAQDKGYGARKIGQLIRAEAKDKFTAYRSTVIARTEGTRAASEGARVGAQQWETITGQKKWKAWSAASDSRTRDNHLEMIGSEPIPGDQDFIVGGFAMDGPGDPRGGAANVVNCRCRKYYLSERVANQMRGITVKPVNKPVETVKPVEIVKPKPATVRKPKPEKPIPQIKPTTKPEKPIPTTIKPKKNTIPDNLDAYEKETKVKIDRSIFDLLDEEVKMVHEEGGSHYDLTEKVVNINKNNPQSTWNKKSIIYHEYGHAIDAQKGLKTSPELKKLMDKYRKVYSKNNNSNEGSYYQLHERLRLDLSKAKTFEEKEKIYAVGDTLMSLNPKYGFGHTKEYFEKEGKKEAEFIAHAFENKFANNPYFEKVAPKLYADMIKFITKIK